MGASGSKLRVETYLDSKESYTILLLGTSLQIKHSTGDIRVASRRSRDQVELVRTDGNLKGILLDIENMRTTFLSDKFPNCDVYDAWNQQRNQGKKEMVDTIKAFFAQGFDRKHIIYYSGHGQEGTGNWVIGRTDEAQPEVVSLCDVLSLWQNSPVCSHDSKRRGLIIISDSCHSGVWVDKLDKQQGCDEISMFASCLADETCTDTSKGGDFTRYLLSEALQFKPRCTLDIVQRVTQKSL